MMLNSDAMAAIRVDDGPNPKKKAFSEDEKLFLVSRIEAYKNILLSKPGETPARMKPYVWNMISDELNRRAPGNDRTASETKKKWQNIVSQCRREMREAEMRGVPGEAWPWLWKKINELTQRSAWHPLSRSEGGDAEVGLGGVDGGLGDESVEERLERELAVAGPESSASPADSGLKSEVVLDDEEEDELRILPRPAPAMAPADEAGPSSLPVSAPLITTPTWHPDGDEPPRKRSLLNGATSPEWWRRARLAGLVETGEVEGKKGTEIRDTINVETERWMMEKRDREERLSQARARFQVELRRLQLRNELLEMEAEKGRLDLQLHRAKVEKELRMMRGDSAGP